jgi:hypothetical protein
MTKLDLHAAARALEAPMIAFLRDIVAIPSLSGQEERVVRRVAAEMERVGFDEVRIDGLGNVLGRIGDGPRVVAFDAHLDTVDVSDPAQWRCDPFQGKLEDGPSTARSRPEGRHGRHGHRQADERPRPARGLPGEWSARSRRTATACAGLWEGAAARSRGRPNPPARR